MGSCNAYLTDSTEYLTKEAVEKFNIKICPQSSILLSFKLTVGRVGIAASDMVTNEAIACLNSDNLAKLAFLYPHLLNYDYNSIGSTSSIATAVNSKTIKSMPINIPNQHVLDNLYAITKPFYNQLYCNQIETNKLINLRDALLPKLMSGDIDVSQIKIKQ